MSVPPPIAGFRMGECLGEGAAGTVYAAVNKHGDELAVKVLRESLVDEPEIVARFRREAEVAQHLRSPYIVQVVGAGRSGRHHWIAYRRLHGETLASRLRREGVLAQSILASLVDQVLRGLGTAHAAGIIHRDIKPANIMIELPPHAGATARARILDFGLAKVLAAGGAGTPRGFTSATATLGTIRYMPPEQVGGAANVDHRADLYAVGAIAYRSLSGRPAHGGASEAVVLHAKLHEDARPLSTATGAPWPRSVEAFFMQALARDPGARFQSAAAMATAWQTAMAGPGVPSADTLRTASRDAFEPEDTVLGGKGP